MDASTRSFAFVAAAFLVGDALLGAPLKHACVLCACVGLGASAWLSQSLRRAVLLAYVPVVAVLVAVLWRVFDVANVAPQSLSGNNANVLPAGTGLLLLADLVLLVGAALLAGDSLSASLLYTLFATFMLDLYLCLSPTLSIGLLLRPRPNAWRPLFVAEIACLMPIVFAALAERLASGRRVAVSNARSAAPVAAPASSRPSASALSNPAASASLSSPLTAMIPSSSNASDSLASSSSSSSHASTESVTCCITQEIMRDPVILVGDGHTYERAAIARWLAAHNTSPMTNEVLASRALVANYAIRRVIDDVHEAQQKAALAASTHSPLASASVSESQAQPHPNSAATAATVMESQVQMHRQAWQGAVQRCILNRFVMPPYQQLSLNYLCACSPSLQVDDWRCIHQIPIRPLCVAEKPARQIIAIRRAKCGIIARPICFLLCGV
jgi:hypothetical protein